MNYLLTIINSRNAWKEFLKRLKSLHEKNRNIASLPHIFYMNFSSPNPAFPRAQSPWSQVASNSPQDHSWVVVGFFCRGHFYSISKYWTNLPTPTSSIHLLSICETHSLCLIGSCKGTAMQNTGNKYFSAASTLDTKVLGLLFSLLQTPVAVAVWQLRGEPSTQCHLSKSSAG